MEPRREELNQESKVLSPATERKLKRFRIVKLEERIAPGKGGGGNSKYCYRSFPANRC
jgi:hypothetical protein